MPPRGNGNKATRTRESGAFRDFRQWHDWGFETAEGALNILASSKTLAGTGAGAILSAFGWGSSDGRFSGSRGVAIELGRIGIYLGKQRFSLRKMLRENPVSYLSYAKKQLGEDDAS
jgi:hypothetical protein